MNPIRTSLLKAGLVVSVIFNLAFVVGSVLTPNTRLPGCGGSAGEPLSVVQSRSRGSDPFVEELEREAGLTADQVARVASSRQTLQDRLSVGREAMKKLKHELAALVAADTPDWEAIGKLTGAIAEQQREAQEATVRHLVEIRAGLEPGQRPVFDSLIQTRMCSNPSCSGACMGGGCPACSGQTGKGVRHAVDCSCGATEQSGASGQCDSPHGSSTDDQSHSCGSESR